MVKQPIDHLMPSWQTDLDSLPFSQPDADTAPRPSVATKKPCRRGQHMWLPAVPGTPSRCVVCKVLFEEVMTRSRLGKNNRKRGNSAELDVAKALPRGRKMGPLGLPWDVEVPGYARLQVKKLATPPSLRYVAAQLARIPDGPELAGFVWIEPGRGGEQLITFRLRPFSQWHGLPSMEEET